mmetsp:Transcript_32087/g.107057  ORF Transcript_32087/g.107057 Transcript_32087/m.107057 type:complete len:415 (-) Transcript_32087:1753-2997(-)
MSNSRGAFTVTSPEEHAPGRGRGDTRRRGQKGLYEHYPSRERKRRTACSKPGTARALTRGGGALSPRRVIEASLCARSPEKRERQRCVCLRPLDAAGSAGAVGQRSLVKLALLELVVVGPRALQVCGALLKELAAAWLLLKLLLLGELELAAARAFRRRRGECGRRPVELGDGDVHHLRRVVEPVVHAALAVALHLVVEDHVLGGLRVVHLLGRARAGGGVHVAGERGRRVEPAGQLLVGAPVDRAGRHVGHVVELDVVVADGSGDGDRLARCEVVDASDVVAARRVRVLGEEDVVALAPVEGVDVREARPALRTHHHLVCHNMINASGDRLGERRAVARGDAAIARGDAVERVERHLELRLEEDDSRRAVAAERQGRLVPLGRAVHGLGLSEARLGDGPLVGLVRVGAAPLLL